MIKVSGKQIETVLRLQPIERYQHSIGIIADTEKMYSILDTDGNWELADIDGSVSFFIWPHIEYAKPFLTGKWKDAIIEEITISEFYSEIRDYLSSKEYLLNVFAVNNMSGFVVTVGEFCRDIEIELEKYE